MKVTVLSHNLSSNAAMRSLRVAEAAKTFAEVELLGPVESRGLWPALPQEPWIRTVPERRLPKFAKSLLEIVEAAGGDVLIAVKPHLASFGAALAAAERRGVPVVLDLDDDETALSPRSEWDRNPSMADLSRPASAVYSALLTRAVGAAAAITVASSALQRRFGGTLLPHGSRTDLFDPSRVDRGEARRAFGFSAPTVLFPGTPRAHKGIETLARAVAKVPGARLAVTCRPSELTEPEWDEYPIDRIPIVPNAELARLLAAADVIAIPQSDTEAARAQMPMKVYDAMAMGRPIVASRVSDLPVVLEGCACLVAPDDVDDLAHGIAAVLADAEGSRAMGSRARERCLEKYSISAVGKILGRLVHGVAA
ncbi:MAG: glycosyltransferase family 4 protein [Acidobacteriota bacterium]